MDLEHWQTDYLTMLAAVPGVSKEDSEPIVAFLAFRSGQAPPGAWERMNAAGTASWFALGMQVASAAALGRQLATSPAVHDATNEVEIDAAIDAHPDIQALRNFADDLMSALDISALTADTQVALLNAIKRQAQTSSTPEDTRLLTEAFTRLPMLDEAPAMSD